MRIYRIGRKTDEGHQGYSFHASLREAKRFAVAFEINWSSENGKAEVDEFEVTPTRAGIIGLLDRCACHNDNG